MRKQQFPYTEAEIARSQDRIADVLGIENDDAGLIERVARVKRGGKKRKASRVERLRELVHGADDADACWLLVRAACLYPAAAEVLFEQPLRTRDDRVLALEIALEAIEQGRPVGC